MMPLVLLPCLHPEDNNLMQLRGVSGKFQHMLGMLRKKLANNGVV